MCPFSAPQRCGDRCAAADSHSGETRRHQHPHHFLKGLVVHQTAPISIIFRGRSDRVRSLRVLEGALGPNKGGPRGRGSLSIGRCSAASPPAPPRVCPPLCLWRRTGQQQRTQGRTPRRRGRASALADCHRPPRDLPFLLLQIEIPTHINEKHRQQPQQYLRS